MAGKYAHVIAKLPRFLGTEPDYQTKVDAVKEAMKKEEGYKQWGSHLARQYASIRAEAEAAKAVLSEINLRLEAIEQLLGDQLENEGVTSIRLDSGDLVISMQEPVGRVTDKEAFRQWCVANGFEKHLQLWPSTMVSVLKERLLVGEPAMTGVEAGWRRTFRLNRAK